MPQIVPAIGMAAAGASASGMAASASAAAAATAGAGAAAAGAGAAATAGALTATGLTASSIFASTATTLAGSLLGGIGQSMFAKDKLREEEAMMERETARRQATYKGVGAATAPPTGADPLKYSASVAPSSTYKAPAQPRGFATTRYNPETRKIEKT